MSSETQVSVRPRPMRLTRATLALTAALVFIGLSAGAANAATGDLTFAECFEDNDSPTEAACTDVDGLDGANRLAVSPDGRSVYVAARIDDAIVNFDRDPATGELTFAECFEDNDAPTEAACVDVDGLNTARFPVVSPDGRSLYVASNLDNSVVNFDRDPATGRLTFAECFDDNDSNSEAACTGVDGLQNVFGVDVSPDGRSVYTAGNFDDAIVNFDRDPATGELTFAECFDDSASNPEAACTDTAGLNGAFGVLVSPDGTSVYSAANADHAVAGFTRDPGTGELTFAECFDDDDISADAACTDTAGLNSAVGLTASPDARSLYVGAAGEGLVNFDRDPDTGALAFAECFDDEDLDPEPACTGVPALLGAGSVATSPDGLSLYASSSNDSVIDGFSRDPVTGALTYSQCFEDSDAGFEETCTEVDGLDDASGVGVSPDGRSVYASAEDNDSLVGFAREPAPPALDASAKRKQRPERLKIRATSDQDATLVVAGRAQVPTRGGRGSASVAAKTRKFKLKRKSVELEAGVEKTVRVRFEQNRKSVRRIARLLKRDRRARKRSKVIARARAENANGRSPKAKLEIKLKR